MDEKSMTPWERTLSLYRREMGDPFATLQREINRVFDEGLSCRNAIGTPESAAACRWPSLGLSESDGAYTVTAELPGMEEKDVEVAIEGEMLTIKGEKRSEAKDEKKHIDEIFYGAFERRVPLAADVDRDKVAGTFKNGVLTLTLPRKASAPAASKRIPLGGS